MVICLSKWNRLSQLAEAKNVCLRQTGVRTRAHVCLSVPVLEPVCEAVLFLLSLTPVAVPSHYTALRLLLCQIEAALSLSLAPPLRFCLSRFHKSQPRSPRVEGSALPAQTATPAGLQIGILPHGSASFDSVEGDPGTRIRQNEGSYIHLWL